MSAGSPNIQLTFHPAREEGWKDKSLTMNEDWNMSEQDVTSDFPSERGFTRRLLHCCETEL